MGSNHCTKTWARRFVLTACIVAVGFSAGAAEPVQTIQEILEKVENHYKNVPAYTAFFLQTTASAASALTTEASGKLYYQKPKQMRWEYEAPEVQTFVVNNNLAWLYVPQERQISLFDARTFFSSALARAFFEGVFELKKQFQVALDHGQSNSSQVTLILTPKEEDPHIQSLRLSIDLQSYRILSAETRDALGNTNRVVVQNQREKPALDPKFFELEVPPATTVIDREGRELSPAEVQQLRQNLK